MSMKKKPLRIEFASYINDLPVLIKAACDYVEEDECVGLRFNIWDKDGDQQLSVEFNKEWFDEVEHESAGLLLEEFEETMYKEAYGFGA